MSASTTALAVSNVSVQFGSLTALEDISFSVEPGERRAVIGPNGAGKSTLFGVIAGVRRPTGGAVLLGDDDVTGMPMSRRADLGIVTTFQHSAVFLRETALENVMLAAMRRQPTGASRWRVLKRHAGLLDHSAAMLERVGLADRAAMPAGELSHGQRRQLEIAMALAAEPRVLLLDEPAAGMSTAETEQLAELVRSLPSDVTLLLVEHNLDLVWDIADRITVLHLGGHLMTGSGAQVQASTEVTTAYLGERSLDDLFFDTDDEAAGR